MKKYVTILLLLCVMMSLCTTAVAEDVFVIGQEVFAAQNVEDAAFAQNLTTACSYVEITCPVENGEAVSLVIRSEAGEMVYCRDYGAQSGTFRSEDVYLRLDGLAQTYRAELTIGGQSRSFPIYRVIGRLTGNKACAQGYPLSAVTGREGWQTVTFLDMNALEGSSFTCDLHASNRVDLGTITFRVAGGAVTASADFAQAANVTVESAELYLARTALEARSMGQKGAGLPSAGLGEAISADGASVVAVYVRMVVSYDPAGAAESLDDGELPGQAALWETMQQVTTNEAVG